MSENRKKKQRKSRNTHRKTHSTFAFWPRNVHYAHRQHNTKDRFVVLLLFSCYMELNGEHLSSYSSEYAPTKTVDLSEWRVKHNKSIAFFCFFVVSITEIAVFSRISIIWYFSQYGELYMYGERVCVSCFWVWRFFPLPFLPFTQFFGVEFTILRYSTFGVVVVVVGCYALIYLIIVINFEFHLSSSLSIFSPL